MSKMLATRSQAKEKYHTSRGQRRQFSGAEAEENDNGSNDKHCDEIDNVSIDEQSAFPPRAKENDNATEKPQESDGSISSHHLGGPPEKKKFRLRLWGNDIETESTSDQIVFPDPRLPRNERGQSERVFNPNQSEIITHRTHTDENLHQSSALNPCDRGKQPVSDHSNGKYNSLPHFQQELENVTAGGLLSGTEKLPEIPQELGSHSPAQRSLNEICEIEFVALDNYDSVSSFRAPSPDDDFVSAVLSLGHNRSRR